MGIPISQTAPQRRPVVTITLLLLNFIIFILLITDPQLLVPGATSTEEAQIELSMIPINIINGLKPWTVITAMFIHADWAHIIGNMLFLGIFGGPVESAMGRKRFIVFYLLGGLAADLFHILSITVIPRELLISGSRFILNPWVTPTLGASGAISAVLAAYLVYYPRSRITMIYPIWIIPVILVLPAWAYILLWFTLQLVMGLISLLGLFSSVAYWAHIGGFLAGMAMAPIFLDPRIKELIVEYKRYLERYGETPSEPYISEEFY